MAIGHFIKEIGRGKEGARALSQSQAADMFGQILDGAVTDLEVGAFCIAMRIKGETPEEMCGFLEALHQRLTPVRISPTGPDCAAVVIPSYNGARKLPVLTPLLALLLARKGLPVLIHGTATEDKRIGASEVLSALGITAQSTAEPLAKGQVAFYPTALLHAGLQRLLDVRRVVNLRNPAHSLVKLMQPCEGPQVLVTSYTHPEYAVSMEQVLCLRKSTALLIRGTEGEAVADPRRMPKMRCIQHGQLESELEHQGGTLTSLPDLPPCDAQSTARYIQAVLDGTLPTPQPIAMQVEQIVRLAKIAGMPE
ncbi:DNA-binding protein YbiB [Rhodoferax lacus]|uniref:DNA-binding protein YbiB n=1 Tax=Rhodoferax lacus TaxID=2184758 RepID=A0A3E1RG77_9BURK|nr:DNA-binding protein YbiB [Rhodoferax lacus]RFO98263.1 DNA-binding protein YbiB [Rhodoferax lacus]